MGPRIQPSILDNASRVPSGMVEPCVSSARRPIGIGRQSILRPCRLAAALATSTAAGTTSWPISSPLRMPSVRCASFMVRPRRDLSSRLAVEPDREALEQPIDDENAGVDEQDTHDLKRRHGGGVEM